MGSRVLVVRADAGVAMGTGHVMRCFALAQAWQDAGAEVVFAMAEASPAIDERLGSERMQVVPVASTPGSAEDAKEVTRLAAERHAAWVVVDGYHFDASYQRSLKHAGLKLLYVDDTGECEHYSADLVLNQNPHAREDMYRRKEPDTRLLLGAGYAMLRREFSAWREWQREIPAIGRKVLVMMGGSDPDNVTSAGIRALRQVRVIGMEAAVVAGGSNPNVESLQQAAREFPGTLRLLWNAANIPELMAWADVAVSAAGTTCWEMCLLGLPALLIDVVPNQRPVAEELQHRQVAIHLGSSGDVSPEKIAAELESLLRSTQRRAAMSQRARELVDGRGTQRVLSAMRGADLHLRRAEEKDCRLLWEWRNDPAVRAASFSGGHIPWEEHQAWFRGKMTDSQCLILVGEDHEGKLIGQLRVDLRSQSEGDIDVSLSHESRGAGYGSQLIACGVEEVFLTTRVERVHAFIRPENQASMRAFERAQFVRVGHEVVKGQPSIHYVRSRDQARS